MSDAPTADASSERTLVQPDNEEEEKGESVFEQPATLPVFG